MSFKWKKIILLTGSALFLVAFENGNREEAPAPLPYDVAVIPPSDSPPAPNSKGLTPEQQEQLKINEDNVMNPYPG